MGINKNNLENLIIRPTLQEMGEKFYSENAVQLLLMTCAAETQMGTYLRQGLKYLDDGKARARGIYQMEPATHDDVKHRFDWNSIVQDEYFISLYGKQYFMECDKDVLIFDLKYATIMARAKYYLIPEKLPDIDDTEGMAHYYSKYWYAGKYYEDRKEKAIRAYNKYVVYK